jgi:hypothetical protein
MSEFTHAFIVALKSYLKFLPVIIIPIAGLVFMITAAPYFSVNKGCQSYESASGTDRKRLALLFGLVFATLLTGIFLFISKNIAASYTVERLEYLVIGLLYGSYLLFSFFGARV